MTKQKIQFSFLLLIGFLFEWWLLYFSNFNIPEYISGTPINITGLLLIILLLTVLIIFTKKLLSKNSSLSIFQLTIAGTIVCFIAEAFFQFIKFFIENGFSSINHIVTLSARVIGMTLFGAALSFFISYQIKTRQTGRLILFIVLFIILIVFIRSVMQPVID